MPINACSINTYSIDAICASKRTKYITKLWDSIPPIVVQARGPGGIAAFSRDFDDTPIDTRTIELPFISITISLNGEHIYQTIENNPSAVKPMVSINKLSSTPSEISVEVINLDLGKANELNN